MQLQITTTPMVQLFKTSWPFQSSTLSTVTLEKREIWRQRGRMATPDAEACRQLRQGRQPNQAKKVRLQCNRSEGRELKRTAMFCSTNVRKNMEGSGLLGPRADIRLEVQFFSTHPNPSPCFSRGHTSTHVQLYHCSGRMATPDAEACRQLRQGRQPNQAKKVRLQCNRSEGRELKRTAMFDSVLLRKRKV